VGERQLQPVRQFSAAGASVAETLPAHLEPMHISRQNTEFVLENAARPERHRHLIVRDTEALALEVLRMILPYARALAHDNSRVAEIAVVENRQRKVRPPFRALDQK